ncbi:hypothetical protein MKW92_001008 [Papaver armeniacum]|nr:hypothetical protein MKW92_001008 [Papaver armeniacum]
MSSFAPKMVSAQGFCDVLTSIDSSTKTKTYSTAENCELYCNRTCGGNGEDGLGHCDDKLCCCVINRNVGN